MYGTPSALPRSPPPSLPPCTSQSPPAWSCPRDRSTAKRRTRIPCLPQPPLRPPRARRSAAEPETRPEPGDARPEPGDALRHQDGGCVSSDRNAAVTEPCFPTRSSMATSRGSPEPALGTGAQDGLRQLPQMSPVCGSCRRRAPSVAAAADGPLSRTRPAAAAAASPRPAHMSQVSAARLGQSSFGQPDIPARPSVRLFYSSTALRAA